MSKTLSVAYSKEILENQLKTKQIERTCSVTGKSLPVIRDFVLQFFRERTGFGVGGNIELNKSTDEKKVGVQNFSGNILPVQMSVAIDRISVGYNSFATQQKGADVVHNQPFPALVRNSILEIYQNHILLVELPMSEFDPRTTGNNVEDSYTVLTNTFKLIPNKPFMFKIRTPEEGTPLTDFHYFEFRAKGLTAIQ